MRAFQSKMRVGITSHGDHRDDSIEAECCIE